MVQLFTPHPISHLFFKHWSPDDEEIGVVIAKGRFLLHDDGWFYISPEAPELVLADVFAGDPALSALVAEQDIAPAKTGTDLIVRGTARSPGGEASSDWPVELVVSDAEETRLLTWGFHVRGPATWQRKGRRWKIGRAEPVTEVPLDYALSYGGTLKDEEGHPTEFCAGNPAGTGFATSAALEGLDTWPAPQIGELGEFLAGSDPTAPMSIRGFRPVAKTWLPRRSLAGTFDEAWARTRHPRMPHDYDLGFWNAAPTALQIRPFLRGNEMLLLTGFDPRAEPLAFPLPAIGMGLYVAGKGSARSKMDLDTVTLDLTDGLAATRLDLTWRVTVHEPDVWPQVEIAAYGLKPHSAATPPITKGA